MVMGQKRLESNEKRLRLMQNLEAEYPDYFRLKYRGNDVSFQDIKQIAIDQNRALINYHMIDEKGYVTYVSPKQTNGFSFVFDSLEIAWIESLQSKKISQIIEYEDIQTNHAMYQKIFQPVRQYLLEDHIDRVTIIPHGLTSYVAFEMLAVDDDIDNTKRLLEEVVISYAYSARLIDQQSTLNKNKPSFDYVGFAPVYDYKDPGYELLAFRANLIPLIASLAEIEQGKKLFNGKIFIREKATTESFLENAPKAKIIHLAMHAKSENDDPLQSGLYFYENEDEPKSSANSKLSLYDIYNLELPSEIVVLSACNTGTGEIRGNEGPISLARGFQYAGAKSVMMNMWLANDEASAKIISAFLQNIKNGDTRDRALQQAKLSYLKTADPLTTHPYFWAGLALYGNTEQVKMNSSMPLWGWPLVGLIFVAALFVVRKKQSTS